MISLSEYMMGRAVKYPPSRFMYDNAEKLLARVNELLARVPDAPVWKVSSGYRPAKINAATPGAAKQSRHMTCEAIDIHDDGKLANWCMQFKAELEAAQLWMEHPSRTPTWVHLQSVPPKSGNRIFYP